MSTRKRILCVEDQTDTCDLIAYLLADWEVICAQSQAEALQRVVRENFDLILLDYHLPDGTGAEICRVIRAFDQKTPVLFVTAFDGISSTELAEVGAQGLIKKGPYFTEMLVALTAQHLHSTATKGGYARR